MSKHEAVGITFDNMMFDDFMDMYVAFDKMVQVQTIRTNLDGANSIIPEAMYAHDPFTALGYAASYVVFAVLPEVRAGYLERRAKKLAPELFEA